jgi:hypothetical protein
MNSWNVELPAFASIREGECLSQMIEKISAGDFFGAEGFLALGGECYRNG